MPLDSAGDLHDPEQDPTEEVDRRQRRHAVHRAIRELPTRHRTAITYTLSGLSPEEVGKQMGIGRNAADALLHRARRSLKDHLTSVRDGAWGVAFGIRMKWDRITRRSGIEPTLGEASGVVAAHSAISLATAAMVAVLAVTGGSGVPPTGSDAGSSRSLGMLAGAGAGASMGASMTAEGAIPVTTLDAGSAWPGSVRTIGPASTSLSGGGTNGRTTFNPPNGDPEKPLLDIRHILFQEPEDGAQGDRSSIGPVEVVGRNICVLPARACQMKGL